MYFNPFAIPPFIVSLLYFFVAVFILTKNKKGVINKVFAFLYFSTFIWQFGYFIAFSSKTYLLALIAVKIAYIGVTFIPILFYNFTVVFLALKNEDRFLKISYIIGGFFGILSLTTPLLVKDVYKGYWGYHTHVGQIHNIYLLLYFFVYLRCVFKLYECYSRKNQCSSQLYLRVRYVFLSFLIATFAGLDFIPHYGIPYLQFYPIGFVFITITMFLHAYAIARYNLMDINIVLTRAGIFSFVYIVVLGIPFLIGWIIRSRVSIVSIYWWMVSLFLMAILASAGPFIYMKLQRRVESRLRAEEFKAHGALRRLSHNMLRFTKLEDLLKLTVHYLVKVLKLKFTAVYLLDESQDKYVLKSFWQLGEDTGLPQDFPRDSIMVKELNERRLPMVTEEMKLFSQNPAYFHVKELVDILSNYKINTVIPSFLRNNLLGIFVLSDRRKGMLFTQEDLNLLMVLSNEAALAIENAQFHQKEKSMLVEKSRRDALADMAPGASHQFNNRLVAISSSAELSLMKLEGIDINGLKDDNLKSILADVKAGLEMIDKEVYKGKEITSAILKHSKAKREFQDLDLAKLIDNTYKLVQISHAKMGLDKFKEHKFSMEVQDTLPLIYGSEALLQDSFFNLIDNAFDAINEKYTMISKSELVSYIGVNFQGEIQVNIREDNQKIMIELKDNGIGLKQENVKKLFTPYFTTKATSGKGTGLGLYVIREFVEAHSGTISCDSKYTEWTIFTIILPVKSANKKLRVFR